MEELIQRCSWATTDLYKEYHDNEWGKPVHDENKLFEMLILEGMQAGLSWLTILNKREAFKTSGTGQSFAETADAGEHIYELDQGHNSRWGCLPDLRRCLIGAPHQKQKQPVIGCTKQDFFTVHNV